MKKTILFVLFLALALAQSVHAYGSYSQDQLNTTNTEQNVTLTTSPYSEIVWVSIARRANITNAEWVLTGLLGYGGWNLTSSFLSSDNLMYQPEKAVDGSFSTYSVCLDGPDYSQCQLYMNYTFQQGFGFRLYEKVSLDNSICYKMYMYDFDESEWVLYYDGPLGVDVIQYPENEFNESYMNSNNHAWQYVNLSDNAPGKNDYYYEGKTRFKGYPNNVTMDIGNDGSIDYTNTTVFNTTETIDLNVTAINNYLHDTCTADWATGTCDVPFNLSSDTVGILEISNININGYYLDPVGNCSGDLYSVSLNFSFSDELLFTSLQADVEYTLTLSDDSDQVETLTLGNVYYFEICSLNYSNYVDMIIQYDNTGYGLRFYFLDNASISGISGNNIALYMLNESLGSTLSGHTQNAVGFPLPEVYVQFQRYYIGENLYRTVAMMRSDSLGDGRVFVEAGDVWYRYVLTQNGGVLRIIGPSLMADNFVLSTATTAITTWEDYFSGVYSSCSYSDATKHIVCSVTDPSGLSVSACLDVDTYNVINVTDYDLTCASGASVTLMVNLTDAESYNNTVRYLLYLTAPSMIILRSGSVSFAGAPQYGLTGILVTIIIVVVCACAGIWNPAVAIFLTVVGFIVSCSIGLVQIEIAGLGSLITVAAIYIYMVKT